MKTIHNIQDESELPLNGSVITLGNFDGIHPGHVALLNRITDISIEKKIPSLVITYHPNPARVLGKKQNFKDIFSFDIKRNLLNNCGIDYFYPIPFTPEFAGMNAYDFLRDVLVKKLKARHIVIGFNHCFGKGREGNFSFLKKHSREFNYDVEEIEEVKFDGEVISSSLIRKNIQEGNIKKANKMLDRIFYLRGTVGRGFQRGKKI
ncbi:MAG: bifunctional riboflavin kinase/FMN adenylyltransferase, partial [Leptospiraceae bacterium]|nr:bifunctional riboflavin kinase/FMN adenylyltransferase [Leptospiraceae bacterium]